MILISPYVILTVDNLLEINNLRPEVLLPLFKKYQDVADFDISIRFLLTLLHAYDLSGGKREDLLKVAFEFALWIKETASNIDYAVKELNYLQVVKRQRLFKEDELQILWDIIEDNSIDNMCKVGAYLLLEQQIPAKRYFKKLSENQKKELKKYPIYHFWKE